MLCNQKCNHYNIRMKIDIKDRLLSFGIKPSLQRMAILDYLLMNATHPTADTIFNDLYPSIPTLSKTTVYNTLKLLEEQGVIISINIDEKNVRYDGDLSDHAHFKCKGCGCIYDLPLETRENIHVSGVGTLTITECQIYYKGYCAPCYEMIQN